MSKCLKCGEDVREGAWRCEDCGTPVPKPRVEPKPEVKSPVQRQQSKPAPKPVAKSDEYVEPKASVPSTLVNKFKTATLLFTGIAMLIAAFLIDKGWTKIADLMD